MERGRAAKDDAFCAEPVAGLRYPDQQVLGGLADRFLFQMKQAVFRRDNQTQRDGVSDKKWLEGRTGTAELNIWTSSYC